jgi:hypothetical protein
MADSYIGTVKTEKGVKRISFPEPIERTFRYNGKSRIVRVRFLPYEFVAQKEDHDRNYEDGAEVIVSKSTMNEALTQAYLAKLKHEQRLLKNTENIKNSGSGTAMVQVDEGDLVSLASDDEIARELSDLAEDEEKA